MDTTIRCASCSSQYLTFARVNEAPVRYHYDCLKPEALTYFVNFEGDMSQHPRTGYTLILDTEQSLVTLLLAHLELDPKLPRPALCRNRVRRHPPGRRHPSLR